MEGNLESDLTWKTAEVERAGQVLKPAGLARVRLAWSEILQRLNQWSEPLSIFIGWRLALAFVAFWAGLLIPAYADHNGVAPPYTGAGTDLLSQRLLAVWSHWDGEWFLHIAQAGYRPGEPTAAFFPLYPMLVNLGALVFRLNYLVSGIVVSGLASLVAFTLLYLLVKDDYGKDIARRSVLYLAAFPTSFFLAAVYSESLFLALALGAFVAARRYSNWWLAGLLIGLAAISRNLGILLLLPIGWEWLRQNRENLGFVKSQAASKETEDEQTGRARHRRIRWRELPWAETFALVSLPLLLVGGWLGFNWIVYRDPVHFITLQKEWMWSRQSMLPHQTLINAVQMLGGQNGQPDWYKQEQNLQDLFAWFFAAGGFGVACFLSWRKKFPFSYVLFFATGLLLPLTSPSSFEPLMSFPRFALVIFPLFIALALLGARWKVIHYGYLMGSLLLLALLLARFTGWYWVA